MVLRLDNASVRIGSDGGSDFSFAQESCRYYRGVDDGLSSVTTPRDYISALIDSVTYFRRRGFLKRRPSLFSGN